MPAEDVRQSLLFRLPLSLTVLTGWLSRIAVLFPKHWLSRTAIFPSRLATHFPPALDYCADWETPISAACGLLRKFGQPCPCSFHNNKQPSTARR